MAIRTKRIHEPASRSDGTRILVDRLWPRGVSKEKAAVNFWARELAPSDELRKWYGHAPGKWTKFKSRYFRELDNNRAALAALAPYLNAKTVTLVFGSKEATLNNASALKEYLESRKDGE